MLNRLEFNSLIDQLKHVSKLIKIIRDENNSENRRFACGLGEDLLNHIYRDLVNITEEELGQPNNYDGTIKTE